MTIFIIVAVVVILFWAWYRDEVIDKINAEHKCKPLDEEDFYITVKHGIEKSQSMQELYRVYIDLIIFNGSYHGSFSAIYKKKLKAMYDKKEAELKAVSPIDKPRV